MKWKFLLGLCCLGLLLFKPQISHSREYLIFSIYQDVPMGIKDEIIKKNYYINMGEDQGLKNDTILDIFRTFPIHNPYINKGQLSNYTVKVGELTVIHVEEEYSIALLSKTTSQNKNSPQLDFSYPLIGDQVKIHLEPLKE